MLRGSFPGHRRYSITHRAVQRLRELVPTMDDFDDESLRDRLDGALGKSEDGGHAVRTLDAMLGEPQVLIPVDEFGEILYAIIKEDTVVTVLPQGHGKEILQRGQALEQRVANGELIRRPDREDGDRWDGPRRRWRREAPPPVVIERPRSTRGDEGGDGDGGRVLAMPAARRPEDPVAAALFDALERGRRQAAVQALREALSERATDASLLPLWNEMASAGIPQSLTVGDLIRAVRGAS
jgi:hypothetical protein